MSSPRSSTQQTPSNAVEVEGLTRRYGDRARAEALAAESFDRCIYPAGVARQLAAMLATGPRADGLRALELPTLVIHGLDDTLIQPDGGERTAGLIPGARRRETSLRGMGPC